MTATVASLVVGTSLVAEPGRRLLGGLCLLFTGVLVGTVVAVERRADWPLLPGAALRLPPLRAGTLASLLNTGTTSSMITLATVYLQDVRHNSPLGAGARLLPFSLAVGRCGAATSTPAGPGHRGRIGRHRLGDHGPRGDHADRAAAAHVGRCGRRRPRCVRGRCDRSRHRRARDVASSCVGDPQHRRTAGNRDRYGPVAADRFQHRRNQRTERKRSDPRVVDRSGDRGSRCRHLRGRPAHLARRRAHRVSREPPVPPDALDPRQPT